VLFAPFLGNQPLASRVDGHTLVIDMRLSVNMLSSTLEQVMARRSRLVRSMANNMLLEARSELDESPYAPMLIETLENDLTSHVTSMDAAWYNKDANFGAAINKAINFKATLPDLATLSKGLERIRITGTGAASKVHLAKHRGTGALYVIKQFSTNAYQTEEALRSIAEEMRIAAAPGVHPNLVRFIDAGIEPGETTGDPSRVFVTLEYCDGGNLEKILQACDHSVPPAPLRGIALQICHGLRYLHQELRQTHRDLKPANILFTFQGVVKLSDFGVSHALERDPGFSRSMSGHNPNAATYMPPERIRGDAYSSASDTWGLGLILLEALAASAKGCLPVHPFARAQSSKSFQDAVCFGPSPRPPDETPAEIADFVGTCLRKETGGADGRPSIVAALQHPWLATSEASEAVELVRRYMNTLPEGVARLRLGSLAHRPRRRTLRHETRDRARDHEEEDSLGELAQTM